MAEQAATAHSAADRITALLDAEAGGPAPAETEAPESPAERRRGAHRAGSSGRSAPSRDRRGNRARGSEASESADAAPDGEAAEVESLADLAKYLGTDVSELYNLQIPVTGPDGESATVTLGEWKDGYQKAETYRAKEQALTETREKFERESAAQTNALRERLVQAEGVLHAAETQLMQEFQSIDWNTLRADDPAEWGAKQMEFGRRQQALEQAKAQAWQHAQARHRSGRRPDRHNPRRQRLLRRCRVDLHSRRRRPHGQPQLRELGQRHAPSRPRTSPALDGDDLDTDDDGTLDSDALVSNRRLPRPRRDRRQRRPHLLPERRSARTAPSYPATRSSARAAGRSGDFDPAAGEDTPGCDEHSVRHRPARCWSSTRSTTTSPARTPPSFSRSRTTALCRSI